MFRAGGHAFISANCLVHVTLSKIIKFSIYLVVGQSVQEHQSAEEEAGQDAGNVRKKGLVQLSFSNAVYVTDC